MQSQSQSPIKTYFIELNRFLIENNIIGTIAGVCIGVATKDLIFSLVGDIIVPLIILGGLKMNIKYLNKILPGKSSIDFNNVIKTIIGWILVIIVTFTFLKISFELFLGNKISKDKVDDKKKSQINKKLI
jgi:large-conductance mechanosensitive channel